MTVEVAEFREDRHHNRREKQLGRLEPVEVGIADSEMFGEVGNERDVVALEHSAHHFDEEQVPHKTEGDGAGTPTQQLLHDRMVVLRYFVHITTHPRVWGRKGPAVNGLPNGRYR